MEYQVEVHCAWWRSCYDGVVHAFPVLTPARLAHKHYRARCTHTAPPDPSGNHDGPPCPICVLLTGEGPPDQRWEPA